MYIVKRFDVCNFSWNYMNTFNTYSEAIEKMEWMKKMYGGKYKIERKEN